MQLTPQSLLQRSTAATFAKLWTRRQLAGRQLNNLAVNAEEIARARAILICVVRNERKIMPFFLSYYRKIGVEHFIFVDNRSDDGTAETLAGQPDVSLFSTGASFREAQYGMAWVNNILNRYCVGKWCLHVDADEFFVLQDQFRELSELLNALEARRATAYNCVMVDLYSRLPIAETDFCEGDDALAACPFYDPRGYKFGTDVKTRTTWIKGGARARLFGFADGTGPALNKTPLVKWQKGNMYIHCAHQLWPFELNDPLRLGKDGPRGALLHLKFTSRMVADLANEEMMRQHDTERNVYSLDRTTIAWHGESHNYRGWKSLHDDGLVVNLA